MTGAAPPFRSPPLRSPPRPMTPRPMTPRPTPPGRPAPQSLSQSPPPVPPPGSARAPLLRGGVALGLLVGVLGTWSVLATLSGAVIAPGRVEVAGNRQVVQHPEGGVVAAVLVREGQAVAAGDVVMRLDGAALRAELAAVEARLAALAARQARLEAEAADAPAITVPAALRAAGETGPVAPGARPETGGAADDGLAAGPAGRPDPAPAPPFDTPAFGVAAFDSADTAPDGPSGVAALIDGQRRLFAARRDTLRQHLAQRDRRIDQTRAQIAGLGQQIAAAEAGRALLAEERSVQADLLARGLAQASSLMALRREEARLLGEIGGLRAARARAREQIAEIAIEKLVLAAERREAAAAELREVAEAGLDLAARRRVLADRIAGLDLRAPVAGIVLGLATTTPRSVVRAADPLMFLVPRDRPLVVAVRLPAARIGAVHPGQAVRLRLAGDASDARDLAGRVALISPDALADEGGAFYRVEVVPDATGPAAADARDREAAEAGPAGAEAGPAGAGAGYGEPGSAAAGAGAALLPGMPVEAYFRTRDRTPLAYLLEPFTAYLGRAFREG